MKISKYIVEKNDPKAYYKMSIEIVYALNTIPPRIVEEYVTRDLVNELPEEFDNLIEEYVMSLHDSGWHRYTPTLTPIT